MRRPEDRLSQAIDELCAHVFRIIRPPPAASRRPQVSATGLASLLLGVSVAMMMCGWVTFLIGFMLMPWMLGLVVVLYLVGFVSSFGRSMASVGSSIPRTMSASPKEIDDEVYSEHPVI